MKGNNGGQKKTKFFTSRIYVPYPIEVILKIISWTIVIVIDVVELILALFMHLGIKSFCVFTILAAVFSGCAYFIFDLLLREAFLLFALLPVLFIVLICAVRLLKYVLTKVIRPPFAEIVFESVAVSFRRPFVVKRNGRRLLKRLLAEQKKESAHPKSYKPQQIDCIDE